LLSQYFKIVFEIIIFIPQKIHVMHTDQGDKLWTIHESSEEKEEILGLLNQKSNVSIFFDWAVWENLKFFCAMNDITGEEYERRAEDLLKENDIYQKRNDLFRNLSGGMQQKVALIRSIFIILKSSSWMNLRQG
jgi:ABC-type multidrug transport system ATPase subunit